LPPGRILDRIDGNTASIMVRVSNDTIQSHDRFAELVERGRMFSIQR
jgi:dihydroorotate dehydrogenase